MRTALSVAGQPGPRAPAPAAGLTMAILKPIPGSPSRLSLGMRQSSKMRLAVDEARIPSLSSFFPSVSPGVGMGTRKALMPWRPDAPSDFFTCSRPRPSHKPPQPPAPVPSLHLPQNLAVTPSAGSSGEGAARGGRGTGTAARAPEQEQLHRTEEVWI